MFVWVKKIQQEKEVGVSVDRKLGNNSDRITVSAFTKKNHSINDPLSDNTFSKIFAFGKKLMTALQAY